MKIKLKNSFFPCMGFSLVTGAIVGVAVFLFKVAVGFAAECAVFMYRNVRENPLYLPFLILGVAVIGLISAVILKNNKDARGGGIPASVAILRGLISFSWLKTLFGVFAAALLSFLGGVPLGTEGPSVQIGTAVGKGTIKMLGKNEDFGKCIMTGGACGGFAVATGAPLSAIIFAFEEIHRRFSALLFMCIALTVGVSTATMHLLCYLTGVSPYLFDFRGCKAMPLKYIWIAAVVGLACGVFVAVFDVLHVKTGAFLEKTLKNIPFIIKIVAVFVVTSVLGFVSLELIGSGHELIIELSEGHGLWYMILICLCVRALILIIANNIGVTGGTFVPALAFGALIGAIFSKIAVLSGILPEEYFIVPIIIGMAAYLAAYMRTPLMAAVFSIEALGGLTNIFAVAVGVALAFVAVKLSKIPSFQEVIMEKKILDFEKQKADA